jgi:hypothetical protein
MHLKHETTHAEMEAKYGPAPHFQIFEIFKKIGVLFNSQQFRRKEQTGCVGVETSL